MSNHNISYREIRQLSILFLVEKKKKSALSGAMYTSKRFCCHFAKRDNFCQLNVAFPALKFFQNGATLKEKNLLLNSALDEGLMQRVFYHLLLRSMRKCPFAILNS